jgi:hypothetical protein
LVEHLIGRDALFALLGNGWQSEYRPLVGLEAEQPSA